MFGWVPAASPLCRGHPAPQGVEINTWSVANTSLTRKISPLSTAAPRAFEAEARAAGLIFAFNTACKHLRRIIFPNRHGANPGEVHIGQARLLGPGIEL